MYSNTNSTSLSTPPPLLIFVLGLPCSGKSTLCTTLAESYKFEHFSLGAEMRQLISTNPSCPAALIKPLFTDAETDTYTQCVTSNTLAPMHLTSKYVFVRIFGVGARERPVRGLIDGFPRDSARWKYFVNMLNEEGKWEPEEGGTVVLVLNVDKEVARKRYVKRGREGDEFEKRFSEHEENIGEVVKAMRGNDVRIVEVDANGEEGIDEMVRGLEKIPEWTALVGASGCASKHDGEW